MPAPAFMIRMVLGEFAQVLLGSQRAIPQKLRKHQFAFHYPDIEAALRAVVHPAAA
jgi:NAD dependent epimerase/dehydratase family enzyme